MGRMVGIDLGTTNTVVAIADGATPRILQNREGEDMTLSVAGVHRRMKDGPLLVGTPAYRQWKQAPSSTVVSVKRLMGRGIDDPHVKRLAGEPDDFWEASPPRRAFFKMVEPSNGTRDSLGIVLGEREYSPVDISARILEKVKADAESKLDGEPITHAVITVPAYFNEVQRKATREAAQQAGLQVIQLLDEPTAAAVAFGMDKTEDVPRIVLVYDFGGGTFDLSILTWAGTTFAPMNLEGDMWLGGDDLDDVIVDTVVEHILEEQDVDVSDNQSLMVELRQEARKAKEILSASDSADILLTREDIDVDFTITREAFEQGILPLVGRFRRCACGQANYPTSTTCTACSEDLTATPVQDGKALSLVRRALTNAHLGLDDIEYVLLAGNTTLVPLVASSVREIFGSKIRSVRNPKLVVAEGAAIVAARVGQRVVCSTWNDANSRECGHVNEVNDTNCRGCGRPLNDVLAPELELPELTLGSIAAFDYSLVLAGGHYRMFVRKGDPYPTPEEQRRTEVFYTQQAGRPLLFLPVVGGDGEERESQGMVYVRLPENTPANSAVQVSIWLDGDGTFRIKAREGNGQKLDAVSDKGGVYSNVVEAIEQAEVVVAQRKDEAVGHDLTQIRKLRRETLDLLSKNETASALEKAAQMRALVEEWGGVGSSLRERARRLIGFTDVLLNTFPWAFEGDRLKRLQKDRGDMHRATLPDADPLSMQVCYDKLDDETDNLPRIVNFFFSISRIIRTRIEPKAPARADHLQRELWSLPDSFAIGDRTAQERLTDLADRVARTSEELGGFDNEKPSECGICKGRIEPGGRYCSAGHDSWMLKT